jgi:hypothetical protein
MCPRAINGRGPTVDHWYMWTLCPSVVSILVSGRINL